MQVVGGPAAVRASGGGVAAAGTACAHVGTPASGGYGCGAVAAYGGAEGDSSGSGHDC